MAATIASIMLPIAASDRPLLDPPADPDAEAQIAFKGETFLALPRVRETSRLRDDGFESTQNESHRARAPLVIPSSRVADAAPSVFAHRSPPPRP